MTLHERPQKRVNTTDMEHNGYRIISPRATRLASLLAALLFAGAFFTRCASVGTPTGGPKDSLPPVITGLTPDDHTTRFDARRIIIEFDEYVQLKDVQKELYTSPAMKRKPVATLRGKGISIQIKDDSLLPNTTYAIEFGSAVADNNEGNTLHGLRYVFSTGDSIDSMMMSGYTEQSETADSLGRTFICFFEADSVPAPADYDSTMFNHKPAKIARSQKNGIFVAQNLRPVPYRVYAFYDANDNQTYEPGVDQVGFVDGTYNPAQMPPFAIWYDSVRRYVSADPQLYFRLFTDVSFRRQSLQETARPEQHRVTLNFAAARPEIRSMRFEGIEPSQVTVEPVSRGRDTLSLWFAVPPEQMPDTLRGEITYMRHDSLNVLREVTEPLELAWRRVETREQERERLRNEKARAQAEAEGREWRPAGPSTFRMVGFRQNDEVNPERDFPLEFATPLTRFDSAAVRLLSWSERGDTLRERVTFVPDSVSVRKWRLRAQWTPERSYRLTVPAGALADIEGTENDSITASLTVADIEKFATLKITVVPREDGAKYVLQAVDANNRLLGEIRGAGAGVHTMNYIPAGDMRLRIIEDMNGNGEWDAGNLVERRQSERAEFYKNDRDEELFTTKTGWEFEITLDMNRIFAPVTMEQLIERLDKREAARAAKEAEKRLKEGDRKKEQNQSTGQGMGMGLGGVRGMMGGSGSGGMF